MISTRRCPRPGRDVKRLVGSFVLAARANRLSDDDGRDAAAACARSYRRHMRDFAGMDVLETWYARIEDTDFVALLPQDREATLRKRIAKAIDLAQQLRAGVPEAGRAGRSGAPHP